MLGAGLGNLAMARGGAAQRADYPNRPVVLVVPYPPGGATDMLGRMVAQGLAGRLGGTFVTENRPGAATILGARSVARMRPGDGHTLLLGTNSTFAVNPVLFADAGYDPLQDFLPVSVVADTPFVLTVLPSRGWRSLADVVAAAKARPGVLTYASAGTGGMPHMTTEIFRERAGVELVHVPYRGGTQAQIDLLGGRIDLYFDTIAGAKSHVAAGRILALAVSSAGRQPAMADVPSVAELGYPGFDVVGWFGLAAPAGTPTPVHAALEHAVTATMEEPVNRALLAELSLTPTALGAGVMQRRMLDDQQLYAGIIHRANIRPDG